MYICMRNETSSDRALPVFDGEGVEREEIGAAVVLAEAGAFGDDSRTVPAPCWCPRRARGRADGPAAVAVHDDGDVAGEAFARDVGEGVSQNREYNRGGVLRGWRGGVLSGLKC